MILKSVLNSMKQLCKQNNHILCFLIAGIVLVIDYITGKNVAFPIVYVLPVGMAAWWVTKGTAYVIAILMPLVRVGFHSIWRHSEPTSLVIINALINCLALFLYAYLVNRIAWQKKGLEREVKVLEGMLPLCAWCRRVRNENGEYEKIEDYIAKHSEVSFSHGICPECLKKVSHED